MVVPSPAVFIDTAALLALANKDDGLHGRAKAVRDELTRTGAPLVTTEWVLTEFLGRAVKGPLRSAAIATIDRLRASRRVAIITATPDGWAAAFDLYRRRPDKEWSLVDRASMQICEARGIRRVFTHDHHFRQAGFETLL